MSVVCVAWATAVASASAAECPGEERPARELGAERAEAAVGCVIDRERQRRERVELRRDERLASAARGHADAMVEAGVFAHVLPGGPRLSERVRSTTFLDGRRAWRLGEVLAWATLIESSPARLVRAWLASPAHRAVLLDKGYREVGTGVVPGTPREARARGVTVAVVMAG